MREAVAGGGSWTGTEQRVVPSDALVVTVPGNTAAEGGAGTG
ncbi:MAG TPA: hypothetical protein VMD59_17145 [Acidimicrobiales bacterium]|nr:hypothetical protein [Acidimicrobiales bacterium]